MYLRSANPPAGNGLVELVERLQAACVQAILTDWREVQRKVQLLPEDAPGVCALYVEADRLRREYQSLVAKAAAEYRREFRPNGAVPA